MSRLLPGPSLLNRCLVPPSPPLSSLRSVPPPGASPRLSPGCAPSAASLRLAPLRQCPAPPYQCVRTSLPFAPAPSPHSAACAPCPLLCPAPLSLPGRPSQAPPVAGPRAPGSRKTLPWRVFVARGTGSAWFCSAQWKTGTLGPGLVK